MSYYNRENVFEEYQSKKDIFNQLKESAIFDLTAILKKNDIVFSVVIGRVKEFESFFKKIEDMAEGGKTFEHPCNEVQDLVGVRIVLLFEKDLDKVQELLTPTFKIKTDRKRFSEQRMDDQFGYESDHYVLSYDRVDGPHYNEVKDIKFELQVRTVLMDAWDSVSHELEYKNEASIPSNMKRVFYGLSGLFVVADQQFQQIKESIQKNKSEQNIISKDPINLLNQEINLDTLKSYTKYKFPERFIKEEKNGKIDNEYSQLVEEIKSLKKYSSIEDIDKIIKTEIDNVYKKEGYLNGRKICFTTIGLIRVSLRSVDSEYDELLKKKYNSGHSK